MIQKSVTGNIVEIVEKDPGQDEMITLSKLWQEGASGASVGLLSVRNVPNLSDHPDIDSARRDLEQELRTRFGELDRQSLRDLPVFSAYDSFYRRFKKSYHVQLQLESIVFKRKSILSPSALVGAMFMAELQTGLLTAAHDRAALELPLIADIALGGESYQRLNGTHQELKAGDLYIQDRQGIISSVIYGPDQRTQIQPTTNQAVYTTYAPPGISREQVLEELNLLEGYLRLFAPQLEREVLEVI
jgi:DNA/RNA-binding domain of Phe-tRNA-synthetase-like protein